MTDARTERVQVFTVVEPDPDARIERTQVFTVVEPDPDARTERVQVFTVVRVLVVPADPSSLTATAISSSRIDLAWTDNASDETGYRVERSPDGIGSWANVSGSLPAGTTSYSNTGLSASTTYFYRVFAFNGAGDSGASNTANATTLAAPAGGDTNRMGGTGAIRRPPRPLTR